MPTNLRFDDLDLREEPASSKDGQMYVGDTTNAWATRKTCNCTGDECTGLCCTYQC